ncbi:MAG: GreA/GreB family elongation factor [Deltaproteobacteria bacterium]|nr:GreA/GreB family elongation factor [Deltaproteobacteria bacterium]
MRLTQSKRALRDELVARLASDLEALERAHRAALEAATHEEAKPENDKDTRALEASYLARGQAMRVEELRGAVAELSGWWPRDLDGDGPVALGALVEVEDDEATLRYFIAPHGGGALLAQGSVKVVTARSPLGRALLGKRAGDDCDVVVDGRRRALSITRVD